MCIVNNANARVDLNDKMPLHSAAWKGYMDVAQSPTSRWRSIIALTAAPETKSRPKVVCSKCVPDMNPWR